VNGTSRERSDAALHTLGRRLLELERQHADERERADTLLALQGAFTSIARSRSTDEIIAYTLRAAFNPLGFSRALFFGVEREAGVVVRFQLDGSDSVEPGASIDDLTAGEALLAVLRAEPRESVGMAGELSAPLVDVRGWYVMSPLSGVAGTLGLLYADGHRRPQPRANEVDAVCALAAIAAVAIDNELLFAQTRALAMRDHLTGLLNRRAFAERLTAELSRSDERGGSLAYVLIDVDDFKKVNDTFGHDAGDAVLKRVAETLVRGSRADDVVARHGGDEFCILLTALDPELAHALVARLSWELRSRDLHCSIGAALYPGDGRDGAALARAADVALYATKAAGKNGFSFASSRSQRTASHVQDESHAT
jgi:diguanylate cyclase (GGDEF)-like protein